MDLHLFWLGPLQYENFKTDLASFETPDYTGIYLRLKLYNNVRTIAYVGQSRHLISGFDQHLTHLLFLRQPLRDINGLVVERYGVEKRFVVLNDIAGVGPMAIEEALRTQFYFAQVHDGVDINYLTLIEAMLKERAENIKREQLENFQKITSEEFDHDNSIVSDFSNLDVGGCELIEGVTRNTPIEISTAPGDFCAC